MASIANDPNGTRRILFTDPHGKRKTLRLGKTPRKTAEAIRVKVESLLASRISGQPVESETARWLANAGDAMHAKLAAVGLVEARATATLGAFIDGFIVRQVEVKPGTTITYRRTRAKLVSYFGEGRDLRGIAAGDAEDWRAAMLKRDYAQNTVRRATGVARQFFKAAKKRGLIDANPFEGLAANVVGNRSRDYFITRAEAAAVLEHCPDSEWRVLFALSRYGGLRCPTETLRLRWADIDWAGNRFTVTSPKTEHHEGKGSRLVPLFPELLEHLREAFELAEPGSEHVVTRYRDAGQNLRTQLQRIIKRAGLKPWPKLWANLRATRATELAQHFPQHVATAWCGHSAKIAEEHYLQVTAEHFTAAGQPPYNPHDKAAQNAAQYPPASGRTGAPPPLANRTETHKSAYNSHLVGEAGFEPA